MDYTILPTVAAKAEIYTNRIRQVSKVILDAYGVPLNPGRRQSDWADGEGPEGLAWHWTGGWSWLSAARWLNCPWTLSGDREGNRRSSAQVLILDRMIDGMAKYWPEELRTLFPVPVLILAPLHRSTWCTNWVNSWCEGIELRNSGPWRKGTEYLGKRPIRVNKRLFEPYTREQMISMINYARLKYILRGAKLNPHWTVGHHMVTVRKSDPGPLFFMHRMRWATYDHKTPADKLLWVQQYPLAPVDQGVDEDMESSRSLDDRDGPAYHELAAVAPTYSGVTDEGYIMEGLYRLGWHVGPGIYGPNDVDIAKWVSQFQRSTYGYRDPVHRLKIDGIPGPKTCAALDRRLKSLRLI